jgi:hypothetical protein
MVPAARSVLRGLRRSGAFRAPRAPPLPASSPLSTLAARSPDLDEPPPPPLAPADVPTLPAGASDHGRGAFVSPVSAARNAVLRRCFDAGDPVSVARAESLFSQLAEAGEAGASQYNEVARHLWWDAEALEALVDRMRASGVRPNGFTVGCWRRRTRAWATTRQRRARCDAPSRSTDWARTT